MIPSTPGCLPVNPLSVNVRNQPKREALLVTTVRRRLRLLGLRRKKRRIDEHFRLMRDEAMAAGTLGTDLGVLNDRHWRESRPLDDEIAHLMTRALLDQASDYQIPYRESDCWELSVVSGRYRLSAKAIDELRAAVRNEKNERWSFWDQRGKTIIMLTSALAGAAGALVGLATLWKK